MRSVNKVILMGNLGADPEVKATATGKTVTTFPLATHSEWNDLNGERQKNTDFHRIVAWQGLADTCGKKLKKGSAIYMEGRIHNRSYEDGDKKRHYLTEITAERINFIQIKKGKEGDDVSLEESEEKVAA